MARKRVYKYIVSWLGSMFEIEVVDEGDEIGVSVSYLPEYAYQIEYRLERDGRELLCISTAVIEVVIYDRNIIEDFLWGLNEIFNECIVLGEKHKKR